MLNEQDRTEIVNEMVDLISKEVVRGNKKEAIAASDELEVFNHTMISCVRLWTTHSTTDRFKSRIYQIINCAIRCDEEDAVVAALPIVRGINAFCCFPDLREKLDAAGEAEARRKHPMANWAPGSVLYRGGGLPDQCKGFFEGMQGHKIRFPSFFATSVRMEKAIHFLKSAKLRGGSYPPVLWHIELPPPPALCLHVNYIQPHSVGQFDEGIF
jgi:hypothetical protein